MTDTFDAEQVDRLAADCERAEQLRNMQRVIVDMNQRVLALEERDRRVAREYAADR